VLARRRGCNAANDQVAKIAARARSAISPPPFAILSGDYMGEHWLASFACSRCDDEARHLGLLPFGVRFQEIAKYGNAALRFKPGYCPKLGQHPSSRPLLLSAPRFAQRRRARA